MSDLMAFIYWWFFVFILGAVVWAMVWKWFSGFWAIIRGFQPDIEGLEKFMDFGFMNSVVRSRFFPPLDMWWAGGSINYYYFGHFLSGMLTKLSGIEPSVTYNLAIANIFGLGVMGAFSVGSN